MTDARIIAAYRQLGGAYAAGAELGISATTVDRVLRAHGFAATGRRRFTPAEVQTLVRAYQAGESVAQLAARLSEDFPKVRRAPARAGVVFTQDRDGRRTPGGTRRRWVRTPRGRGRADRPAPRPRHASASDRRQPWAVSCVRLSGIEAGQPTGHIERGSAIRHLPPRTHVGSDEPARHVCRDLAFKLLLAGPHSFSHLQRLRYHTFASPLCAGMPCSHLFAIHK